MERSYFLDVLRMRLPWRVNTILTISVPYSSANFTPMQLYCYTVEETCYTSNGGTQFRIAFKSHSRENSIRVVVALSERYRRTRKYAAKEDNRA